MERNINLFTEFYVDKKPERAAELITCLKRNLANTFTQLCIYIEAANYLEVFEVFKKENIQHESNNLMICVSQGRPTFDLVFSMMQLPMYSDGINIFANSDIYFEPLDKYDVHFEYLEQEPNVCFALSRWDVYPNGNAAHFERADSQDTWVFNGYPNLESEPFLEFTAGTAGCDNRVAHELKQAGYNVLNPSKTFVTYHLHNSNVRNYIDENGQVKDRVPPPYLLVKPY